MRPSVRVTLLLALALLACRLGRALPQAPSTKPVPAMTEQDRRRNLDSFEHVWKTVGEKYWDPRLGGINWQAVHDELRPQVERAKSTAQAREVMREMLRRLGQSHFNIIPGDVYTELSASGKKAGPGALGFAVRVFDGLTPHPSPPPQGGRRTEREECGQVLVTEVSEGLAAARLGVRPGWVLLKVDGQDLGPALARVRQTYNGSTFLEYRLVQAVLGRLHGKVGERIAVTFRDGEDHEVTLAVPLVEPPGVRVVFGNLPPFSVRYKARQLPGGVACFSLNAFFDPVAVMRAFEDAVQQNLHASGFIIDLRGNPGGIGAMAAGFGSWFVAQEQVLGTMTTRTGVLRFVLNPRPETYDGPLAILVDGLTGSTSEILAGGLQDLGRARIFGRRSAGAALPSAFERLPNGDGFQYAFADYVSAGGRRLEGRGVRPDMEVTPSRQALLLGHDPVLEAAQAWIGSQKKNSK